MMNNPMSAVKLAVQTLGVGLRRLQTDILVAAKHLADTIVNCFIAFVIYSCRNVVSFSRWFYLQSKAGYLLLVELLAEIIFFLRVFSGAIAGFVLYFKWGLRPGMYAAMVWIGIIVLALFVYRNASKLAEPMPRPRWATICAHMLLISLFLFSFLSQAQSIIRGIQRVGYRKLSVSQANMMTIDRGDYYYKQHQFREALTEYRKALQQDGNSPSIHRKIGNALWELKRRNESIAEHRKAISLDPKYKEAHYCLANALMFQQKYEQALSEYQQVLRLDPDDNSARHGLASALYWLKRYDESEEECRRLLQVNYEPASVNMLIGQCYFRQRRWPETYEHLKQALVFGAADKPHISLMLYYASQEQGKGEEAIKYGKNYLDYAKTHVKQESNNLNFMDHYLTLQERKLKD